VSRLLKPGEHNYNFVDMTGKRVGRLLVLRRVANVCGNARWLCACDCDGECIVEGIRLRSVLKQGRVDYCCPECRPKRKGTVQRRVR
jgi:hypothetical protein